MGQEAAIIHDHVETVKVVAPKAATVLLERQPNALERFLRDINFPPQKADGELVGKGTFQIIFDRKLGADDQDGGNSVAMWLYCEWSEADFEGGDRFILASGTITSSQDVEVNMGGLAVVKGEETIEFFKAGRVKLDGETLTKMVLSRLRSGL